MAESENIRGYKWPSNHSDPELFRQTGEPQDPRGQPEDQLSSWRADRSSPTSCKSLKIARLAADNLPGAPFLLDSANDLLQSAAVHMQMSRHFLRQPPLPARRPFLWRTQARRCAPQGCLVTLCRSSSIDYTQEIVRSSRKTGCKMLTLSKH